MWHNAEWIEHPIRLELTHVGLLVKLANHYTTNGADRVINMAVLGVMIYKTPVSSLGRQDLYQIQIAADQNFNEKKNISVVRAILNFAVSCLTIQTGASSRRAPRGLFWTSVRSVALEKEQWQTWGL